jgi:hypothetical protein
LAEEKKGPLQYSLKQVWKDYWQVEALTMQRRSKLLRVVSVLKQPSVWKPVAAMLRSARVSVRALRRQPEQAWHWQLCSTTNYSTRRLVLEWAPPAFVPLALPEQPPVKATQFVEQGPVVWLAGVVVQPEQLVSVWAQSVPPTWAFSVQRQPAESRELQPPELSALLPQVLAGSHFGQRFLARRLFRCD